MLLAPLIHKAFRKYKCQYLKSHKRTSRYSNARRSRSTRRVRNFHTWKSRHFEVNNKISCLSIALRNRLQQTNPTMNRNEDSTRDTEVKNPISPFPPLSSDPPCLKDAKFEETVARCGMIHDTSLKERHVSCHIRTSRTLMFPFFKTDRFG